MKPVSVYESPNVKRYRAGDDGVGEADVTLVEVVEVVDVVGTVDVVEVINVDGT